MPWANFQQPTRMRLGLCYTVSPQCTKYAFGLRAKYAWVPDGDLASEYLMSFDSPPKPDKFRNLEANTDTILSFIKEWMIYLTDSDRDQ